MNPGAIPGNVIYEQALKATASISIFAPRGRAATWTVARAGKSALK
jgi:hypothetical protein